MLRLQHGNASHITAGALSPPASHGFSAPPERCLHTRERENCSIPLVIRVAFRMGVDEPWCASDGRDRCRNGMCRNGMCRNVLKSIVSLWRRDVHGVWNVLLHCRLRENHQHVLWEKEWVHGWDRSKHGG